MNQSTGDSDFAEVVQVFADQVFRYALFLTGDYHQAKDLTQEVFCRAFRKWSQLRTPERVWPWLCRICGRLFLNQLRSRNPEQARPPEELDRCPGSIIPPEPEEVAALRQAMARLPARFRLLLTMFYFEELSYQEIAERLHIPVGTVMSGLHRAKRRLRKLLSETSGGMVAPEEKQRKFAIAKDLAREAEKKS